MSPMGTRIELQLLRTLHPTLKTSQGRTCSPLAHETLTEDRVAFRQIVMCSSYWLKRASAVFSTGGVVDITSSAESPSRDFGSTIFIIGAADDRYSRRPT